MSSLILFGYLSHYLYGISLTVMAIFLMLLVLVQRGRGGGLAGAFGGMGGQSAFGTKAGDTFTRVTIVSATLWLVLCLLCVKFLGNQTGPLGNPDGGITSPVTTSPEFPSSTPLSPADSDPAATDPAAAAPATSAPGFGSEAATSPGSDGPVAPPAE